MMARTKRILLMINFFILTIFLFSVVDSAYALREAMHRSINEYVAKSAFNGFSLNDYLKNQLGMQKGYDEKFAGKEVFILLGDGGESEDSGNVRSMYHFLNPITNQGLFGGYSALTWATMAVGGQKLSPISSWNDVRSYYYLALTSKDKTTRDDNFARTFQGVGQVMHLVEDMSVPAHVRDDKHLKLFGLGGDGYENWMDKPDNRNTIANFPVISFVPDVSFLLNVKNLFDTEQYNSNNPGITTSSNSIGLAEYTNANFFNLSKLIPYSEVQS